MSQQHALVIDDNAQNRKVLVQLLSKQGIRCTEIADPRKLSDSLPTMEAVDVVFLDLEMPGLDGYEVKTILREQLVGTPIVACTVHVSEINVVKRSGFDGFIGKPVDHSKFPEQWARILNGQQVWERA